MTLFSTSKLPSHGTLGEQSSWGLQPCSSHLFSHLFPISLGRAAPPQHPQDGTHREQHHTELRSSRKSPKLCRRRHCQAIPSLLQALNPLWLPGRANSLREWAGIGTGSALVLSCFTAPHADCAELCRNAPGYGQQLQICLADAAGLPAEGGLGPWSSPRTLLWAIDAVTSART